MLFVLGCFTAVAFAADYQQVVIKDLKFYQGLSCEGEGIQDFPTGNLPTSVGVCENSMTVVECEEGSGVATLNYYMQSSCITDPSWSFEVSSECFGITHPASGSYSVHAESVTCKPPEPIAVSLPGLQFYEGFRCKDGSEDLDDTFTTKIPNMTGVCLKHGNQWTKIASCRNGGSAILQYFSNAKCCEDPKAEGCKFEPQWEFDLLSQFCSDEHHETHPYSVKVGIVHCPDAPPMDEIPPPKDPQNPDSSFINQASLLLCVFLSWAITFA